MERYVYMYKCNDTSKDVMVDFLSAGKAPCNIHFPCNFLPIILRKTLTSLLDLPTMHAITQIFLHDHDLSHHRCLKWCEREDGFQDSL